MMVTSAAISVCFFAILLPHQIYGQTGTNCAVQNFGSSAMNYCCKRPSVVFAVDPYLKQCNPRKLASLTQWANSYVLNKLQNFRMANAFNITADPNAIRTLCGAAPFINCLFNVGGFITKTGSFNTTAMISYVMSRAPTTDKDWPKALKDITDQIDPIEAWIPNVFKNSIMCPGAKYSDPKVKVDVRALVLTQIFQMALINNCPEPVESSWCFGLSDKYYDCTDYVWESLNTQKVQSAETKKRRERVRNAAVNMKEYADETVQEPEVYQE